MSQSVCGCLQGDYINHPQTGTQQGTGRKHSEGLALQPNVRGKSSDHQNSNSRRSDRNNFRVITEEHYSEGKFKNSNQIPQPIRQVEMLELIFDIVVANAPDKND
jgi:hypothetical protein